MSGATTAGMTESAGTAPSPAQIAPAIEAVLITIGRPVSAPRLGVALGLLAHDPDEEETGARAGILTKPQADALIAQAVRDLNDHYDRTGRSFRIEMVAGGYRLVTRPEFAGVIAAFARSQQTPRLSRPALETLAIIAYRQPVTRAELEAIRGVSCGEVLKTLMERRLITIKGRAEEVGRPILYGTTQRFLEQFGLASLKDLPAPSEVATG